MNHRKEDKPHILFIMSDQHRYDCLGCYGNLDIKTPHLDHLSADGVVYDNSFCASPMCTPSRYSILTGLYPHQHMGWNNKTTIPAGLEPFPDLLKKGGYQTKLVGKMHMTPTYMDVGFEKMELAEHGNGKFEDDYHRYLQEHDLIDKYDFWDNYGDFKGLASESYNQAFGAVESELPEEHYSTTWIGDRALSSIEDWDPDDREFLTVSFLKPHHPFDPPAPWSSMYNPEELSLLPGWTEACIEYDQQFNKGHRPNKEMTEPVLRQIMAYYYATISQIDHYVGKMVELLKARGLYDNTLIIYTSDHGEYMGFHHMVGKLNYMYDPVVKVPLIVKHPQQLYKGSRTDALVNNIDLAPTLLNQAGCSSSKYMPGIDFFKHSKGSDYVFSEQNRGRQYMVRSKSYKLIFGRDGVLPLFFDLKKDPFELNNLYKHKDYQEFIQEHKEAIFRMMFFDATTPLHLDESYPTIDGVPDSEQKQELEQWFRQKLTSDVTKNH